MRVRTAEQVARRAVLTRRLLRAVPRGWRIEVSLFWLGAYGLVMALVGSVVAVNVFSAVVQVFYSCVRVM
jgi:hypothetical protein